MRHTMIRQKRIVVRVNESEYLKIKTYAENKGLSISEVLRDFVKSLPDTPLCS